MAVPCIQKRIGPDIFGKLHDAVSDTHEFSATAPSTSVAPVVVDDRRDRVREADKRAENSATIAASQYTQTSPTPARGTRYALSVSWCSLDHRLRRPKKGRIIRLPNFKSILVSLCTCLVIRKHILCDVCGSASIGLRNAVAFAAQGHKCFA